MDSNVLGKAKDKRFTHSKKAKFFMQTNESGTDTEVKAVQFANVKVSILVSPLGRTADSNAEQL